MPLNLCARWVPAFAGTNGSSPPSQPGSSRPSSLGDIAVSDKTISMTRFGPLLTDGGVTFRLWAPAARAVDLGLIDKRRGLRHLTGDLVQPDNFRIIL